MYSVIIPAHDEELAIGACLEEMTRGMTPGELDILVVANDCSDRTAAIARGFGPAVRVVETGRASKIHALRLGDEQARHFPRFYVDADVLLPIESIRRVGEALDRGDCLAAAPRMRVDTSRSSWAVRAYYEIWTRLPYHQAGMIGSGVYALSKAGRERFGEFPEIVSDDGFVRLQFAPGERATVEGTCFVIAAPTRMAGVLSIKTRSQKGALQLRRAYPELLRNEQRAYGRPLAEILRSPRLWAPAAVYFTVIARTRMRAYRMNQAGQLGGWERDETSRAGLQARSSTAQHPIGEEK